MPELPEVETVRLGLAAVMENKRLTRVDPRRADLRFAFPGNFAARLAGRQVVRLSRRAKYLLGHLDDGAVLIMHLGMSGSFRIHSPGRAPEPGVHDHVIFTFEGGTKIYYTDPRRFGYMDLTAPEDDWRAHKFFVNLGPEPLGNEFSAPYLLAKLRGRTSPVKAALLDQRVVAGLGNIYVCEVLHQARINPRKKAGTVVGRGSQPNEKTEALVRAVRDILSAAIKSGGSSLRDYVRTDGELGYFQHHFRVYGKSGHSCFCGGKGAIIKRIVQGGRSTFYCPACQR